LRVRRQGTRHERPALVEEQGVGDASQPIADGNHVEIPVAIDVDGHRVGVNAGTDQRAVHERAIAVVEP
jgi:hypothetical protein